MATVGAVVVHYHRPDDVLRLVKELLSEHGFLPRNVVVVDNGSNDDDLKPVTFTGVTVTKLPNLGYGAGVNHGAASLTADLEYVLVLTHEVSLRAGTVVGLRAALERHATWGQVAPLLMRSDMPGTVWSGGGAVTGLLRRPANTLKGDTEIPLENDRIVQWVDGSVFMMRMNDFRRVGGVAEEFFLYFEDVDFGWKVRHCLGKKVVCLPPLQASQAPGGGLSHFLAVRNLIWMHWRQDEYVAWALTIGENTLRMVFGSIFKPAGAVQRQKERFKGLIHGIRGNRKLRNPLQDHCF